MLPPIYELSDRKELTVIDKMQIIEAIREIERIKKKLIELI